jgi:hypothetical protein
MTYTQHYMYWRFQWRDPNVADTIFWYHMTAAYVTTKAQLEMNKKALEARGMYEVSYFFHTIP